ncbi:MAG: RNA methyltransferase substrate-binding domain-containing protein, partial [candidate division Zixibacteria bacterium]|nr:RNA methyltransferase substrate-binding domain-containing protein [candidate division Zixibacteria bacterium]
MEKMKRKGYSGLQRHEKKEGRSNRTESREEWIYGINPVLEVIKSGRGIKTVYLSLTRNEKALE